MEIILAKTAGFCFGVDNAVNTINRLLDEGYTSIYTLGPIIHNEHVVNNLKARGVKVADSVDEVQANSKVVIRAHGVTPDVYREISAKHLTPVEATCPYVRKIHTLVKKKIYRGLSNYHSG